MFAAEAIASQLTPILPNGHVIVHSGAELTKRAAKRDVAAIFIDFHLLPHVDGAYFDAPIVAVMDEAKQVLRRSIGALDEYPWLSHIIGTRMLSSSFARTHLALLVDRLSYGTEHAVLGPAGIGRVALLARASRREARFERIQEFFAKHGIGNRTLATIAEVSEELVMNALYDAPVEAGMFREAIPRTEDVEMPEGRECEISYGIEKDKLFVRVRDPFGSLSRRRLLEVLSRCNSGDVGLDISRGGAGLGLWRVFQNATTISITVVPNTLTDIIVEIATKEARGGLMATHLFFALDTENSLGKGEIDHSITLVHSA